MQLRNLTCAVAAAISLAVPDLASVENQEPPSIIVQGEARTFVKPDLATIDIGVVSEASSASQALAANSAAMSALVKTIAAQEISERDVQTSNLSISPMYSQNSNGRTPRITGYSVTNTVSVKVRKVAQLGSLLDAVVGSGANQINQIAFSVDEQSKVLDSVRKQAIEDAKRKALIYAEAGGVQLGKILNVIEAGSQSPVRSMQPQAFSRAEMASVPIASGEQELRVDTTVVFSIQ